MNPLLRIAGIAAAAIVAIAIGLVLLRPPDVGRTVETPQPSPTALPASPASSVARPIPNGTFQASVPVADILADLDANTTLSAQDKTDVIDDILGIRGATTLNVEVTVGETTFTLGYSTDSEPIQAEGPWALYVLDPSTIAVGIGTDSSGIQAYRITRDGTSFRMRASSPAEPVESFVRSVLFETAPFSPKP